MTGATWGWIDRSGDFTGPAVWVAAGPFEGGLARAVRLGSMRTVLVTPSGRVAVEASFDTIASFHDGLAAVNVGGGADGGGVWGFVDRAGVVVIPLRYPGVDRFAEGLAAALTREGWGFLNRSGELEIRPSFEQVTPFSEGLAAVASGGSWAFVDRQGQPAVPGRFDGAFPFVGGLGRVRRGDEEAFLDREGRIVGRGYLRTTPLVDGIATCTAADGDRRVDGSGRELGRRWDELRGPVDGVWAVRRGAAWSLVDLGDEDRGAGPWDEVDLPVDGLARVRAGGGWGVVDVQRARVIVPPTAEATATPGEGRAARRSGGRWTLRDRDGVGISDHGWTDLGRFGEGCLAVRDERGWTMVDSSGQTLFPSHFARLGPMSGGRAAARPLPGRPVLAGPTPGLRLVPRLGTQHPALSAGGALRLCLRFEPSLTGSAMIQAHQRFEGWRGSLPEGAIDGEPWFGAAELQVVLADRPDAAHLASALVDVLWADGLGLAEVLVSRGAPWPPGSWDAPVWPVGFAPGAVDVAAPAGRREGRDVEVDASFQFNLHRLLGPEPPQARFQSIEGPPRRWLWRFYAEDLRQSLAAGQWRQRSTELLEVAAACALRSDLAGEIALARDGEDVLVGLVEGVRS